MSEQSFKDFASHHSKATFYLVMKLTFIWKAIKEYKRLVSNQSKKRCQSLHSPKTTVWIAISVALCGRFFLKIVKLTSERYCVMLDGFFTPGLPTYHWLQQYGAFSAGWNHCSFSPSEK